MTVPKDRILNLAYRGNRFSHVSVDDREWPVVIVTVDGIERVTNERMLEACPAMLAGKERHAVVFVLNARHLPDVSLVRTCARWLNDHENALRAHSAGAAFVVPSAVVRGSLKAIFHLTRPPMPVHTARSLSQAHRWFRAQIQPP